MLRAVAEQGTGQPSWSQASRKHGNKARGYTQARKTCPVRRVNKTEYNLQQVTSLSLLHYYRENLGQQQQYPLHRESCTSCTLNTMCIHSNCVPFQPFCVFTLLCGFTVCKSSPYSPSQIHHGNSILYTG